MYIFVIIVHVVVCVVLILVVLLQAGRGGGMYSMSGGSQAPRVFGTQTSQFMIRATEICAVLFLITSLSLGIISTQKGKSLMERRRFSETLKQTALPAVPASSGTAADPAVTPESAPKTTTAAPLQETSVAPVSKTETSVTATAPEKN